MMLYSFHTSPFEALIDNLEADNNRLRRHDEQI